MAVNVGIGYDSHRFAEDRPLVLGGVEVEYERGLTGHSDADVVTHAVIDAVRLRAARGLANVYAQLQNREEQLKSLEELIELLRTVVGMLRGPIRNIDITVICEQPKLKPYRAAIVRSLGDVTSARVNFKASTNEGMGWIGRGEGIACMAVASVDIE